MSRPQTLATGASNWNKSVEQCDYMSFKMVMEPRIALMCSIVVLLKSWKIFYPLEAALGDGCSDFSTKPSSDWSLMTNL